MIRNAPKLDEAARIKREVLVTKFEKDSDNFNRSFRAWVNEHRKKMMTTAMAKTPQGRFAMTGR